MHKAILIAATMLGSWVAMQACHELGHVAAAMLTGGRVAQVVLNPLTISRTDLADNPRPLVVVWAGPLLGVTLPLVMWLAASAVQMPGAFVLRFFAGFCLLANGLYIGVGSFNRIGDCGPMLEHGSQLWQLWLFGAAAAPPGLWLWHGQAVHFGLGKDKRAVAPVVAYTTLLACMLLLVLGFAVGGT
jgi:hypothetical protein